MNIEFMLLLIVVIGIVTLITVIHSIKGFKIKWHRVHQRFCLHYEIWIDFHDPITDENSRDLRLVVKKLPKFLNIFKPKSNEKEK